MESRVTRPDSPARVISKVANPCIISVIVLSLIAYTESSSMRAVASWVAVILLFLVLLPLIYVYMRTARGRNGIRFLSGPTAFLKQHPRDVLVLSLLSGLPCAVVLVFLEAPSLLLCTIVALLACSVVVALFNIYYRVSYHLAAVTTTVIMAALTWGQGLLVLLAAIPLIGWAKYHTHEHTLAQLAMGIALSVALSGATLYFFG